MSTQIFQKGFSFNPTNLDELKNAMFDAEEYAEKCRTYYPLPKYKVRTKLNGKQWKVIILELDDKEVKEELKRMEKTKEAEERLNKIKEEQESIEKLEKSSESEEER